MEVETFMSLNLVWSYRFFMLIQIFSILIMLFSENWMLILFGLELRIIRLLPLLGVKNIKNFTITYFIINVFGSIFIIIGQLKLISLFFILGVFLKISSFPVFWFPLSLNISIKFWFYFWIMTFQKFPLYILWKEYFIGDKILFVWFGLLGFIISRIYIFYSKSFLEIIAWKNSSHSVIKLILLRYLSYKEFFVLYLIYILSLFIFFFVLQKNNINPATRLIKIQRSNITIFFLSILGLPLFIKVLIEIFLFIKLKKKWAFFIILGIIMQIFAILQIILRNFIAWKTNTMEYKLFVFVFLIIGFCLLLKFWNIKLKKP